MSEADVIKVHKEKPVTQESLESDLKALGIRPGMTLLVHSSLSSLGWVCGGPVAVILALEQVLGPRGTLVMPTHSGALSDPAEWTTPPVPEHWWKTIRETMPAFSPDLTPTNSVGVIPECFRKQEGTLRSDHPEYSFAAWGHQKEVVTAGHALDFGLGDQSPLGRIYDLDGWVLLLGVNHEVNTSLHLAEHRANYPGKQAVTRGAPVIHEGRRQWKKFEDIRFEYEDFGLIGESFGRDRRNLIHQGTVASAEAQLFSQRLLVDYAIEWMEENRKHEG